MTINPKSPTPLSFTPKQQQLGMRYIYAAQAIGNLLLLLVYFPQSAFGTLLIKHIGGTDLQAMLLGTTMWLAAILQLPISLSVHPDNGKRFMLYCWFLFTMMLAGMATLLFLPYHGVLFTWLVLGILTTAIATQQSGSTFWFPLLHDVIPSSMRGRFFGWMRGLWCISLFVGSLATGALLGNTPATWKFQLVLFVACFLFLIKLYLIHRIPQLLPGREPPKAHRDWKIQFRNVLRHRNAMMFAAYYIGMTFFIGFMNLPLVLYMKHLGFPPRDNIVIFAGASLGMVLMLPVGGHIVDRAGTKRVFLASHLVMAELCGLILVAGYLPLTWMRPAMAMIFVISGGIQAVAGLAAIAQVFHLAPSQGRAFFMSTMQVAMSIGPALSPVVAGAMLGAFSERWSLTIGTWELNIFQVMVALAGTGLIAIITMLRLVENVHPQHR